MYVLKAKNDSLKETNADLKSLLEVINVEKIKQITEWEQEAHKKVIESRIADFMKDQEPNLEKIAKPRLQEVTKMIEEVANNAMLELVPFAIDAVMQHPKENRLDFIENNFGRTKDFLIKYFKEIDEI